jgi:hypothetical protein
MEKSQIDKILVNMADKEPHDGKHLSLPVRIVLIVIVLAPGWYGATHPNNPLSVLIKMLLAP